MTLIPVKECEIGSFLFHVLLCVVSSGKRHRDTDALSYVMTHRILPLDPYDVEWVGGENSGHT